MTRTPGRLGFYLLSDIASCLALVLALRNGASVITKGKEQHLSSKVERASHRYRMREINEVDLLVELQQVCSVQSELGGSRPARPEPERAIVFHGCEFAALNIHRLFFGHAQLVVLSNRVCLSFG